MQGHTQKSLCVTGGQLHLFGKCQPARTAGQCGHSVTAAVLLILGPRGSLGSIVMRLLMGQCWLIVIINWHTRWAHARPCAEGFTSHRWSTPPLRQGSTCSHCRPMWAFRHGSCPASFRPTRQSRPYPDALLMGQCWLPVIIICHMK